MTAVTLLLLRTDVPDDSVWQPTWGAWFHTGRHATDRARRIPAGLDVAIDIETPSLTDSFTIKCVTASWVESDGAHAVLLDPGRRPHDAEAVRTITSRARWLILHNAPFDIPGLFAADLLRREDIAKVMDTLVLARSAWPDTLTKKGLEALAGQILALRDLADALKLAQRASGLTSNEKWFREADIHIPLYRAGAMADTLVTLRLAHPLFEAAIDRQLNHPFAVYGCTDRSQAAELVMKSQLANQVMLRQAAIGYDVDLDYLDRYVDKVEAQREAARRTLIDAGLRPGVGMDLVNHLADTDHLPPGWPRTAPSKTRPEGTLKTDKATMEAMLPAHPLADAHRVISDTKKILGYMEKVAARSRITGRLHPQFQILGASATGRMSVAEPELQQFSEDARPIILPRSQGLHSIDWSSIEPALLGWMSQDWEFITPFEQGADIYEPIGRTTGKPRKTNKVVVLAGMYGQGALKLSQSLGCSMDAARLLQAQMRAAMPRSSAMMKRIKQIGEDYGLTITAAGRVLTIPRFNGVPAGYKAVNFCLTPDTPILTADLRHVPAGSVIPGQRLVGFDEFSSDRRGRGTGKRFFRTAIVEAVSTVVKESVVVRSDDGRETACSADHLWLVRVPSATRDRLRWVRADQLTPDHQLLSLGVWETDDSRTAGYLAGLYDGEGSMSNRAAGQKVTILTFSQKPGAVMDSFRKGMESLGLNYSYSPRAPRSTSPTDNVRVQGLARMMRTVGTLRPERFIARSEEIFDGAEIHTVRQMEACPHVVSVTPVGALRLTAIQTNTRTLVANGYLSHNCFQGSCADLIYEAIINAEREGLGDAIMLPMHDEIVCDSEAAADIQRIMSTPPEYLLRWTGGRVPVIRTDAQGPYPHWVKV